LADENFPYGNFDVEEMRSLLAEAEADPLLKGFVFPDEPERKRLPIFFEEKLVGFATPRQDPDGVWRMGALFVKPEFRKRGLAKLAIRTFMTKRRGRSFIEEANLASRRAYKSAGFRAVRSATGGRWWENF
jgi:RimJ/RimL family protein N-acetyltransferase